ncbi:HEXXH motif domain-containing protein [Streptomyces sp. NPDC050418]|uniref:HEXXH motif domain-containing protein n=1 Tax=Streptomyces sp. NPDC050418 TaxID=3365612 RepID=UPI00379EB9A7
MGGAPRFPSLTLAGDDLAALAAGGTTPDALTFLELGERTRRLVLLKELLGALERTPGLTGPLGDWTAAWQLLERAATTDPDLAESLLTSPQIGSWLAHTLRRLNGQDGAAPLWSDIGRLHALAGTAALRTGLDATLPVPLRDGTLSLPGTGLVRLPGRHPAHGTGTLTLTGGHLTLTAGGHKSPPLSPASAPGPYWQPLRLLQPGRIRLDDIDPYRDLDEPVRAQPLEAAEFASWQRIYADAHALLTATPADATGRLGPGTVDVTAIHTIVPWRSSAPPPATDGEAPVQLSASTGDAYASMVISRPPSGLLLAETLVHEFQHSKLAALLHHFPLVDDDRAERYYAPWRSDPRHLTGLLHGAYAFTGVAGFWRERLRDGSTDPETAAYYFALRRLQARLVVRTLTLSERLTEQGRAVVEGLAETLGGWLHEAVPAAPLHRARTAARLHRTEWRLRNVRPPHYTPRATEDTWPDPRTHGFARAPQGPETADELLASGRSEQALAAYLRLPDPGPAVRAGALVAAAAARPGRRTRAALARPERTPWPPQFGDA